jgi:hypothetical protein
MNPNEKNALRLDGDEQVFFDQQLALVKSRTYDVQHKALKALTLLPVSVDQDPGATHVIWRSYDKVGMAKIIADYANDFPRADIAGEEHSSPIKDLGMSYGYSIKEIRRAQKAGVALDVKRAEAARRAIDEKQDSIAWKGDAKSKLPGFFNAPGITEYVAANGAGGSKTWASKTADEIVADFAAIITTAPESTNGIEQPDTVILPLSLYNKLMTTPYGTNRDKTIMGFIRENYPQITRIDWVVDLATAGAGGASRVMAYARDPMKVEVQIPQRFEQLPPQLTGMVYDINCLQSTGGTLVYYPMSVVFCDGL